MMHPRQLRIDCSKPGTIPRARRTGVLLGVLLAATIFVVDLPLVHHHDEPGLYNEECALDRLAARAPGAPSPDATRAPDPLPVCETVAETLWVEPLLPCLVASPPRAPPVVV
jgi:hypothetical protein